MGFLNGLKQMNGFIKNKICKAKSFVKNKYNDASNWIGNNSETIGKVIGTGLNIASSYNPIVNAISTGVKSFANNYANNDEFKMKHPKLSKFVNGLNGNTSTVTDNSNTSTGYYSSQQGQYSLLPRGNIKYKTGLKEYRSYWR